MFNEGISHAGLLVDLGVEAGVVDKSGAWYSYGKERIGQGRENAKLYLKDNVTLAEEVEDKVKQFLGIGTTEVPVEAPVEAPGEDAPPQ
jgi:recombination protein RecA